MSMSATFPSAINIKNSEMHTSGANFVSIVDLTCGDDDTNSYVYPPSRCNRVVHVNVHFHCFHWHIDFFVRAVLLKNLDVCVNLFDLCLFDLYRVQASYSALF